MCHFDWNNNVFNKCNYCSLQLFKKKQSLKEIMAYLSHTFGIGIILSLSGFIINYIANYDISFISYKHSIPIGYIVSLVILLLLTKIINKINRK